MLQSKINELYQTAHELLYLGVNGEPIYVDRFSQLNIEVYQQVEALIFKYGSTAEEEASLCVALLAGYKATLCNHGDKDEKIQSILDRSWEVLEQLPANLLKCRLLVACYAEVFDEELALEAHRIIDSWGYKKLPEEEREVIEDLRNLEENPYPWSEVEE
ncbi:UpxZ family transcription anti-terminator antagonist [Bacteroides sp. 51]|uniref:UpxZ family transcription anti-terminator antagonist n=1 Tax=Bacteroides sp. 51 TaxID=2302938 RepID=UPI0013D8D4E2|nr:UpxZ family transcription anti-terminator antagonist [Bacteroides sp. 51]NDV83251.1 transcriptional regulator [Bacteroides sp. 51]